jgi:DNA topoisomerase IA
MPKWYGLPLMKTAKGKPFHGILPKPSILDEKIKRIVFHEITKNAILKAVENPVPSTNNLLMPSRRAACSTGLVGYEISPILWKKLSRHFGRKGAIGSR